MKVIGLSDAPLLFKKVLIGIIVTVIPFLILFGGLWLTKKVLSSSKNEASVTTPK
jgi:hypothetical protein